MCRSFFSFLGGGGGAPLYISAPPAAGVPQRHWRRTVDAGQPRVPAVQRQQGIRFAHTTDDRQLGNRTVWLPLPSFPLPRMVKPHLFSPAPGPGMPMTAIVTGEVRSGAGLTTRTAAHEAEVAAARPRRTPLAARGIDAGITTSVGGQVVSRLSRTPPVHLLFSNPSKIPPKANPAR